MNDSSDLFPGMPKTSEDALIAAHHASMLARHGFGPKPGRAPLAVQATRLRRLGAWLLMREQEAAAFARASIAAERRARARCAQFETAAAEAW